MIFDENKFNILIVNYQKQKVNIIQQLSRLEYESDKQTINLSDENIILVKDFK